LGWGFCVWPLCYRVSRAPYVRFYLRNLAYSRPQRATGGQVCLVIVWTPGQDVPCVLVPVFVGRVVVVVFLHTDPRGRRGAPGDDVVLLSPLS